MYMCAVCVFTCVYTRHRSVRRPGRYVHVRAYVATAGPAKPVTHRLHNTNTSLRNTDSNTKRGSACVRTGTLSSVPPLFLLHRSSPSPFSSPLHLVPFSFFFFSSPSLFFFLSLYLSLAPCYFRSHLLEPNTGICTNIKPRLLPRLHTHRPGGAFQWTARKPIGIS